MSSKQSRLTTTQFLALRSIGREPWDHASGRYQWKYHGEWFYIDALQGLRTDLLGTWSMFAHGNHIEKAMQAAADLIEAGLAEVVDLPAAHPPYRVSRVTMLTARGRSLLAMANSPSAPNRSSGLQGPACEAVPAGRKAAMRIWSRVTAPLHNLRRPLWTKKKPPV